MAASQCCHIPQSLLEVQAMGPDPTAGTDMAALGRKQRVLPTPLLPIKPAKHDPHVLEVLLHRIRLRAVQFGAAEQFTRFITAVNVLMICGLFAKSVEPNTCSTALVTWLELDMGFTCTLACPDMEALRESHTVTTHASAL